jgi:hypothetical protein
MGKFYNYDEPLVGSLTGEEIITVYQDVSTRSVSLGQVFEELSGFTFTSPSTGEILIYNGTTESWENGPVGAVSTLIGLLDTNIDVTYSAEVPAHPGPDVEVWVTKFGAAYWTLSTGTWNGTEYESAFVTNRTEIYLRPTGGWDVGYRPTKVRVTWDQYQAVRSPSALEIIESNDEYIVDELDPFTTPSMTYVMDFSEDTDIDEFHFISDRTQPANDEIFKITNIEFLEVTAGAEIPLVPEVNHDRESLVYDNAQSKWVNGSIKMDIRLVSDVKTGNYTLTETDIGKRLVFNVSGATSLFLPEDASEAIADGFQCVVRLVGTGSVAVTPAGSDQLNAPDDYTWLTKQYGEAVITKSSSGVWEVNGELDEVGA